MSENKDEANWDEAKLDANSWLVIPEFGVQPRSVDYEGFSDPIVLDCEAPDQLIQSMRFMVSVLRQRAAHHFKSVAEQRINLNTILAALERHNDQCQSDSIPSLMDYHESLLSERERDSDQPSKEKFVNKEFTPMREFTPKETAAFTYMIVTQQFKRALKSKGREAANEYSTGADALLYWILNDTNEPSQAGVEKVLQDYKIEISKKANDQRHADNRREKAFIFQWLDFNRDKFKTDDETAQAIVGILHRKKNEPDHLFNENGYRKKIVDIGYRTASSWITAWNKERSPKKR